MKVYSISHVTAVFIYIRKFSFQKIRGGECCHCMCGTPKPHLCSETEYTAGMDFAHHTHTRGHRTRPKYRCTPTRAHTHVEFMVFNYILLLVK